MSEKTEETKRFYVTGKVQGVFFRANAQDRARQLQLTGWVRNLPDGRVEALAAGSPDALQIFEEWLWQGPEAAHVARVDVEKVALPSVVEKQFQVR